MKINLGKWGALVAAAAGAIATVVTDGVLDTPDLVTIIMAVVAAAAAGYAGVKAYNTDPREGGDAADAE